MDQAGMDGWVRRVLGVQIPVSGNLDAVRAAQEGWAQARSGVVETLKQLEAAIRRMKHPSGDAAIIEVKAVAAQLTRVPATRNAVAELRRYMETDDVVREVELPNGFGIDVSIRRPLSGPLLALERALPASGQAQGHDVGAAR